MTEEKEFRIDLGQSAVYFYPDSMRMGVAHKGIMKDLQLIDRTIWKKLYHLLDLEVFPPNDPFVQHEYEQATKSLEAEIEKQVLGRTL